MLHNLHKWHRHSCQLDHNTGMASGSKSRKRAINVTGSFTRWKDSLFGRWHIATHCNTVQHWASASTESKGRFRAAVPLPVGSLGWACVFPKGIIRDLASETESFGYLNSWSWRDIMRHPNQDRPTARTRFVARVNGKDEAACVSSRAARSWSRRCSLDRHGILHWSAHGWHILQRTRNNHNAIV